MTVFINGFIHVYIELFPITATASSDDALALFISTYTVFEFALLCSSQREAIRDEYNSASVKNNSPSKKENLEMNQML